jgi:hypothetical protein
MFPSAFFPEDARCWKGRQLFETINTWYRASPANHAQGAPGKFDTRRDNPGAWGSIRGRKAGAWISMSTFLTNTIFTGIEDVGTFCNLAAIGLVAVVNLFREHGMNCC